MISRKAKKKLVMGGILNLVILLSIFFSACVFGSGSDEVKISPRNIHQDCIKEGVSKKPSKKRMKEHIRMLSEYIAEYNADYARVVRADCYSVLNDYEKSNSDLTYLIKKGAWNIGQLHFMRGGNNKKLGKLGDAVNDYSLAISMERDWFSVFLERADAYREQNEHQMAIRDLVQALNIMKNRRFCENGKCRGYSAQEVNAYNELLEAYKIVGMSKEYEATLEEALKRNPDGKFSGSMGSE